MLIELLKEALGKLQGNCEDTREQNNGIGGIRCRTDLVYWLMLMFMIDSGTRKVSLGKGHV